MCSSDLQPSQIRGTGLHLDDLPNVVAITVLTYRKTAQETVSDPMGVKPVLDALAAARFIRREQNNPAVLDHGYLVQFTLKDGTSFVLTYLPAGPGANVEDGPDAWWEAPALDAALAPFLPAPLFHDGRGWSIISDITLAQSYGWAPVGNYLDRWPQVVYLHAGTKIGYEVLTGLSTKSHYVDMEDLPKPLQVLEPYHVENFLCIFKDHFGNGGGPTKAC